MKICIVIGDEEYAMNTVEIEIGTRLIKLEVDGEDGARIVYDSGPPENADGDPYRAIS